MKMFLFFSHKLTQEQIEDAKRLGVEEFVYLPDDLQSVFSNVSAEIDTDGLKKIIKKFALFLLQYAKTGDYALIQGDFGVVYHLVNLTKSLGIIPVYATTKRVSKEIEVDGKVKKTSEFKHIRFRRY